MGHTQSYLQVIGTCSLSSSTTGNAQVTASTIWTQAVKLFFALTNAIFDAGICAWGDKRAFDSVRPITAIRYTFQGQPIRDAGNSRVNGPKSVHGLRAA